MDNTKDRLLRIAIEAAKRGGDVLMKYWENGERLDVDEKGKNDYVTQVDREAEKEIVSFIHSSVPDHDVVAEEFSRKKSGSRYVWLIDPLDGTTNYIHRFPVFCVSVSLLIDGEISVAAVFDPIRNDIFQAVKDKGAHLNQKKLTVSHPGSFGRAVLATGFPFREQHRLENYLKTFEHFVRTTSGIRRAGSAAIDLCYTAAGIFDGFWEMGLSSWDIAAGALLVREAGGIVTDFHEGNRFLETGDVVAASPFIHAELMKVIREAYPDSD
ncbi:MAG: inositol monophosphatase family protein [Acidobacteriota bacterium]